MSCEALAMVEAQETGDLYRSLFLEFLCPGFDVKQWESFVHLITLWSITDCKDLFDAMKKPGNEIEDRRLRMDLAGMKRSLRQRMFIKWTATKQMPADALPKVKEDAIWYLRYIMREHVYAVTAIDSIEDLLQDQKVVRKCEKKANRGRPRPQAKTRPVAFMASDHMSFPNRRRQGHRHDRHREPHELRLSLSDVVILVFALYGAACAIYQVCQLRRRQDVHIDVQVRTVAVQSDALPATTTAALYKMPPATPQPPPTYKRRPPTYK